MNKNHWESVAKMLGVELGEEFHVLDEDGDIAYNVLFKFSEVGMIASVSCKHTGAIEHILSGVYTIKKLPWKPKDKELFWYADIDGCVWNSKYSANMSLDRLRYKSGNCFKTQEEAEKNADRIVAMMASDELFGNV